MGYSFFSFGHPNITAKHKNTIEFTKDKELSLKGDCIIGVNSDFDLKEIKKLIKNSKRMKIEIKVDDIYEEINCELNPGFDDDKEIVIRKGEFVSKRTLGIKADKVCADLNQELIKKLSNKDHKIEIILQT
jgi:hypothetical protein